MKPSIPRLRRVRFKSGGEIRVLPNKQNDILEKFKLSVRKCLDGEVAPQMMAYAMVTWARDGRIYVAWNNSYGSGIPSGGIPQHTKDILMADLGAQWADSD
mgnify:CR=1 FL=1